MTLAPFAHYFVSEPDRAEAERLREQLPREAPWRQVTVMTEAIASRRGVADLHVTAEPGMRSLLEPDAEVTRRFYLAAKFTVASMVKVSTLPLDEAGDQVWLCRRRLSEDRHSGDRVGHPALRVASAGRVRPWRPYGSDVPPVLQTGVGLR
jgi:hypothetical protein